jgi:predicted nucleic acid-binding protein
VSAVAEVVLVDSNVILDVRTQDATWFEWSAQALADAADRHELAINPIIYAEVSVDADRIEDLDEELPDSLYRRLPLPYEAGFVAGKAFLRYRRGGGERRSPLPDFYIGAHAAVDRLTLLTRDAARYGTYFPTVKLISPR